MIKHQTKNTLFQFPLQKKQRFSEKNNVGLKPVDPKTWFKGLAWLFVALEPGEGLKLFVTIDILASSEN